MDKVLNIAGMVRLPWEPSGSVKDRNFLRKLVFTIFSEEEPGTGGGKKASRYRYVAEETPAGKVVLIRPAHLKKGFDFVIHLEGWRFKSGKSNPKHEDIAVELKKKLSKLKKEELIQALEWVFKGEEPEEIISKLSIQDAPAKRELPLISILKVLKWMFIEQDIRDWNYSGRKMLMDYLKKEISNS